MKIFFEEDEITLNHELFFCQITLVLGDSPPENEIDICIRDLFVEIFDFLYLSKRLLISGHEYECFVLRRIKKRAGIPKDFRPLHGLLHVYASMLASSGKVDMYTLQKLLTHKSPQNDTTLCASS